jgi:PAS domain S-box-containing protein
VADREDYLTALEEFRPDLILSSDALPGFGGIHSLADAKEKCPEVPFILVGAAPGGETGVEILKRGATDYILKDRLFRLGPACVRAVREAEQCRQHRQAESRFRTLLECAPDALILLDRRRRISFVNSQTERIFGYQRGELVGKRVDKLVPELLRPLRRRAHGTHNGQVQAPANGSRQGLRAIRKDGIEFTADISLSPLTTEQSSLVIASIRDVTKRKEAEERLRESEERFRQITESIKEVFWLTDLAKNRMIYVSPGYEEIWGRSCESLYASPRNWLEAIHPEDRERILAAALTSQVSGEYDEEYRIIRPDGCVRWIQDRAFPIRDSSGKVFRIAGIAEDITRNKETQFQLIKLGQAVESTSELICITDMQDRLTFVNQAFQETYGYTAEEVIGKGPEILLSSKNSPSLLSDILRKTRSGGWQGEVLDRRKDGTEFPIFLSTSLIKDAQGQAIGLIGVARDITGHKRAEAQIRLLADAVQSTQEMISITDSTNRFTFVNRAFLRTYGYSETEVLGKTPDFLYSEKNTPGLCEQVYQTTLGGGWHGEIINRRKDGTEFPISLSTSQINDGSGRAMGLIGVARDVSERVKAAQTLQAAEAKYRTIFEHATDGIFRATPEGRFVVVNPALASMFGYASPEEMMTSFVPHVQTFVLPERLEELKRVVNEQGFARGFEAERYRKDGSKFWVSLNVSAVRDAEGNYLYFEGTEQDITERRRAEIVLRESEEKFRTLFESAAIGIALNDANGRFVHANQAYQQMVGYTDDQLRELGHRRITHPEDLPDALRVLQELRDGKREHSQREKRYLHKNGQLVWGQAFASALRNSNGDLTYIISMVEDITERKAGAEALRESERKLRLIAENTTDVIFAFDMDRRPIYVNPAVQELTGYSVAEVAEKGFINWIHRDDEERMLKYWENLYTGKGFSDVEFRMVTKSGQVKWCSSTWGPLLDETGRQIGVQGSERDISERKRLEKEVLETSSNERRRIGHELHDGLGQYLAGIAFRSKALEQSLETAGAPQAGDAKELTRLISGGIAQTRSLARGLDPVDVETSGLPAALQNLAAESTGLFNIDCQVRCAPTVRVAPQPGLALYRIAQEAIHNAITHGEAGRVEIDLEIIDQQLVLKVRDNGSGFNTGAKRPGGMGLRVMMYRASSVGGHLNVRSQPKSGTEVCCILPQGSMVGEEDKR